MKNTKINVPMTLEEEERLQNLPISDEMRAFIRFVHKKPLSQLMPRKHESALTSLVKSKVGKLHAENPNMPIKKVITTVFEPLTDDIPAPLMLKLTQKIIDMWEKLSLTTQQDNRVAVAA